MNWKTTRNADGTFWIENQGVQVGPYKCFAEAVRASDNANQDPFAKMEVQDVPDCR